MASSFTALRERGEVGVRALVDRARPTIERATPVVSRAGSKAKPYLAIVSPLGWTVLGAALVAWIAGAELGWRELLIFAAAALVLLVVATGFTVGRATLSVDVTAHPQRVSVGQRSAGRVRVRNVSQRRLLPLVLEVPVGRNVGSFQLPTLAPGAEHETEFLVPTDRRTVIPVGPASTMRGDPLGLLRRAARWTGLLEIFVHPRLVSIEPNSWGFLRDLEGRATQDISVSDLAFHALREYVPGDDVRHVHWRSSARTGALGTGQGTLMVRQFVDTRRSHLVLVTDGRAVSYADEDEFEMALSVAASLGIRNVRDEQDTTLVAADQAAVRTDGRRLLDALSRAAADDASLVAQARSALHFAPDASMVVLITGRATDWLELRAAAQAFPVETRILAVRVDVSATSSVTSAGGMRTLVVASLDDLPGLIVAATA